MNPVSAAMPARVFLHLLDKFRLELHRADTINFTIDVVILFCQADILRFGSYFYHRGRTLDFKVFDHADAVTVLKDISMGIAYLGKSQIIWTSLVILPFMTTFGADVKFSILICVCSITFRANGQITHMHIFLGCQG